MRNEEVMREVRLKRLLERCGCWFLERFGYYWKDAVILGKLRLLEACGYYWKDAVIGYWKMRLLLERCSYWL